MVLIIAMGRNRLSRDIMALQRGQIYLPPQPVTKTGQINLSPLEERVNTGTLSQLLQERLCGLQVLRIEAFGKPIVDRRQLLARSVGLA